MSQNRNSRPAPTSAHDDKVEFLAHTRRYSQADLQRLATEVGKVLDTPDEDVGVFATNPHRCLAAVRTALCLLGRRATRAIEDGTGPGTAWAPFEDLAALARNLGKLVEDREQAPKRDSRPETQPRPEESTTLGDTLSPEAKAALAAIVVPPRPTEAQADAASRSRRGNRGNGKANGAEVSVTA